VFSKIIRKKIGELLIERGIITSDQLERALADQRLKGGYVSQHLIALKFASEYDIAVCLSNQYHLAYLPLKNYLIPPEVLKKVPLKWINIFKLIPVDEVGSSLSIAMADPLNEGAIQMIQQITNRQVCVFISTFSEIEETINRYFKDALWDVKKVSESDIHQLMIVDNFIQTRSYNGRDRRRFVRIARELDVDYQFHGQTFSAKTVNISFAGTCFNSSVFVPLEYELFCKIYFDSVNHLDCVVKVLRVENRSNEENGPGIFEIGGVFEFMDDNDRSSLVNYLKSYL
jgi:hypothetical protein